MSKVCSGCGDPKELDEFHKNRSKKDGHQGECKECARESVRKWNEANPLKHREHSRKWREANPEKAGENVRKWKKANPKRVVEYDRKLKADKRAEERFFAGIMMGSYKEREVST